MMNQHNRKRNGDHNRGNQRNAKGQQETANVFAPYNFVAFPQNPAYIKEENEIIGHDVMAETAEDGEELFSGEISYTLEAMTPVFIDDGTNEHRFCRNAAGKCVIPGSTMRGLIRSHVMVLGLGNVRDEIDDYSLMFRDVAAGLDRKRYGDILGSAVVKMQSSQGKEYTLSVLKNVRAGYIEKTAAGKYVIYRTEKDPVDEDSYAIDPKLGNMNYYTISERVIIEQYLAKQSQYRDDPDRFPYSFLIPGMKNEMMNQVRHFQEEYGRKGYKGTPNDAYLPYYRPVAYKLNGTRNIGAVKPEDEAERRDGFRRGTLVSTGFMQKKKVIYVIPEIDHSGENGAARIAVELSDKDVRDFKIDFNRREKSITLIKKNPHRNNEKKVREYKAFFDLPEETGEKGRKPVFYILLHGRCYFGFTPRLRLFYDHTVSEGISRNHVKGKTDFVKAIFGYTQAGQGEGGSAGKASADARKTRVSFSDAVQEGTEEELPVRYLTLSEPRPTDCLNYLNQSDRGTTYNSVQMELRGAKQYWLHTDADPGAGPEDCNEKMDSAVKPLDKGSRFRGKIRFKNLRKYELGLLLWSIRLEKDSWMNLGKAKAYGYGAMRLASISARRIDYGKAYGISGLSAIAANGTDAGGTAAVTSLFEDPYRDLSVDELVNAYRHYVRKYNGNRDIEQLQLVRDFFAMKDSRLIPGPEATKYMPLEEYQKKKSAKTPLPQPVDVIKENPGKTPAQTVNPSGTNQAKTDAVGSATGNPRIQNEKIDAVIFLAGYKLSESQREKLVALSGLRVETLQEWPTDENVARLSREYSAIALPGNAYPRFIEISKRFCKMVFKAKKTGKLDDGWTMI